MCQGNISEEEVGAQDGRSKDEVKVLSRKGKDEAAVVMNAKVRCPESPVNQANESPVDQAKEEIEYWLEVKRLLVDPSDEARDQLEKLMEKREERESVTQLRSENGMVASAKDSLAYMAIDIRGAVDDALLAVEDQQSLRLSRKCKTALDLAWKQYQTSHTLYVTKEKDEALEKGAFVQRRQHKKAFDAALEGLEEYIESLEGEPVEEGLADETALVLATLIEAKAEEKASVVEVEDEICAAKAEVVVVELLAKDKLELCATKGEVEEHCKAEVVVKGAANKVEVEIYANEEVLLRSGQLDPGEGAGIVEVEKLSVKEVKWPNVEVKWLSVEVKLLGFLGYEFVLQVPEARMLRFVNWGSHSLRMKSDNG